MEKNKKILIADDIELFLSNDIRVEADAFLLPDMHQAVNRIYRALFSGEKIVIYGDFDADGIVPRDFGAGVVGPEAEKTALVRHASRSDVFTIESGSVYSSQIFCSFNLFILQVVECTQITSSENLQQF